MPHHPHPAILSTEQLVTQCRITRTRGSGPGGQHRNKVETAIVITHLPTGISAAATERRSQHANQTVALQRLRINLAIQHRSDAAPSGPSPLWLSRCRSGRISINADHADFPALLAEALDQIHAAAFDLRTAAAVLACTPSQLIKLVKLEPAALTDINRHRIAAGLHSLR